VPRKEEGQYVLMGTLGAVREDEIHTFAPQEKVSPRNDQWEKRSANKNVRQLFRSGAAKGAFFGGD
jgi:hypothetical protein